MKLLLLICFIVSFNLAAYNKEKHKVPTKIAFDLVGQCSNYFQNLHLSKTAKQIIISANESIDKPSVSRGWNWHFYDKGYSSATPIIHNNWLGMNRSLHLLFETKVKELNKLVSRDNGSFDLYKVVGQLMHLIQDMAVPAHVAPIYHAAWNKDDFDSYTPKTLPTINFKTSDCELYTSSISNPSKLLEKLANFTLGQLDKTAYRDLKWKNFWKPFDRNIKGEKSGFSNYGFCSSFGADNGEMNHECYVPMEIKDEFYNQQLIQASIASFELLVYVNRILQDETDFPNEKDGSDYILLKADSFRFENDMFSPTNDDQNYTYGMAWSWGDFKARKHILNFQKDKELLWGLLPKTSLKEDRFFQIGLTNFTPDNLSSYDPIIDDRPYASLLYLHSEITKYNENTAYTIGTTYGFSGLRLGGKLQAVWHDFLRWSLNSNEPVEPKGWSNQVNDGGAFSGKLNFSAHKRLSDLSSGANFDLVLNAEAYIGYYIGADIGATLIVGCDILPFVNCEPLTYRLPHHVTSLAKPMSSGNKNAGSSDKWKPIITSLRNSYMFFNISEAYVDYNLFLQCGDRAAHCFESEQLNKEITEMTLGIVLPFESWELTLSVHKRDREFNINGEGREHEWGGFTINWKY